MTSCWAFPWPTAITRNCKSVVGFLLHTHVLRTRLSGEMTFRDLLSRVQKAALDLYIHRAVPFDQVVQKLQPERNLSYTPLFQVMLNWRDRDQQAVLSLDWRDWPSIRCMAAANTSKFDLFSSSQTAGDEIWLELEYSTDLFRSGSHRADARPLSDAAGGCGRGSGAQASLKHADVAETNSTAGIVDGTGQRSELSPNISASTN